MIEGRHNISQLNTSVTWITLTLTILGLINLYSATSVWGQSAASSAFYSQIAWMLVGWSVFMVFWLLDYHFLERFAYPLYLMTVLGLVAVLIWGTEISGHQSWIKIGPFQAQPSEFAKIGFILALAKYFSAHDALHGFRLRDLSMPFLMLSLPLILIIWEGDLGSALFFVLTFLSIVLFVGVKRKTLASLGSLSIMALILAYIFILTPYQKTRIQTFIQPDLDPRGQGYQIIQSKIAVGSGRLLGKGYMQGMQNKLLYLPEKHTDFVFPVLAEEWGFIGAMSVLLLYFALVMAGTNVAAKARDRFGLFVALGISILIFWQVTINLGGVLGLMPLTGVTLPLFSYGGSSLLTIFAGLGILLSIRSRRQFF